MGIVNYSDRYIIKKLFAFFTIVVCFLLVPDVVIAIPLKGVVLDSKTHEPLPFVNIWIKGTTTGVVTNDNGEFSFDVEFAADAVIVFSFVGYTNSELSYISIGNKELLTVYLTEESIVLEEVEVRPNHSYTRFIMMKIVRNRKHNNPDNFEVIDYKKYMRESIFLSNLNRSITKKKAFRKSANAFIRQSDSTVAMPVYISEQYANHSINKDEKRNEQEITKTQSEFIMPQFQNIVETIVSGKTAANINFYNNQIDIMSRGFPSPIAWNNQMFYNIYLNDSIIQDGIKLYKLNFYPKSYRSTAFKGYFWVDSETFALTEIYAKLPSTANVNFVDGFVSHVYYQPIAGKRWFYKEQKFRSSLSLATNPENNKKQRLNITIQKVSNYYHVNVPELQLVNQDLEHSAMSQKNKQLPDEYQMIPYDSLEVAASQGIRMLKQNKSIRFVGRFSDMALNGYYNLNKIDFGSYMDVYRNNAIEGHRFTLPLRTSEEMFKNFSVGGYIGYGFKDKMIKYGGKINFKLPSKQRTILTLKYDNDYYSLTKFKFVEFIRENPYEAGGGNVMSSITTRVPNPYMIRQQKISSSIEFQLGKDIGLLIRSFHNSFQSNDYVPFTKGDINISSFSNYGVLTDIRFSFRQPFDDGFFYRVYYGNQKPVIHLSAIWAKTSLDNGEKTSQPYLNIDATLKNRINLGPAYMRMLFNVGYITGKVPYPLLFMTRGTRDLGFARYHYNLLHNSSFMADLYTNVYVSLNGGGILFGKLPLIKKLNLRETVSFKSFWGQQRGNHSSVMDIPDFLREPLSTPYMELGLGISNIFKVLRIEYVRRLNQAEIYDQFSSKHGVRLRMEVSF